MANQPEKHLFCVRLVQKEGKSIGLDEFGREIKDLTAKLKIDYKSYGSRATREDAAKFGKTIGEHGPHVKYEVTFFDRPSANVFAVAVNTNDGLRYRVERIEEEKSIPSYCLLDC